MYFVTCCAAVSPGTLIFPLPRTRKQKVDHVVVEKLLDCRQNRRRVKVSRPSAKPTLSSGANAHASNSLEMADEMLLWGQTKWRATGHSENTSARGRFGCPFAIPGSSTLRCVS
jgi:hypothetical protein